MRETRRLARVWPAEGGTSSHCGLSGPTRQPNTDPSTPPPNPGDRVLARGHVRSPRAGSATAPTGTASPTGTSGAIHTRRQCATDGVADRPTSAESSSGPPNRPSPGHASTKWGRGPDLRLGAKHDQAYQGSRAAAPPSMTSSPPPAVTLLRRSHASAIRALAFLRRLGPVGWPPWQVKRRLTATPAARSDRLDHGHVLARRRLLCLSRRR